MKKSKVVVLTVKEFFERFSVPKGFEDIRLMFSDDDFVRVSRVGGKLHCSFRSR